MFLHTLTSFCIDIRLYLVCVCAKTKQYDTGWFVENAYFNYVFRKTIKNHTLVIKPTVYINYKYKSIKRVISHNPLLKRDM